MAREEEREGENGKKERKKERKSKASTFLSPFDSPRSNYDRDNRTERVTTYLWLRHFFLLDSLYLPSSLPRAPTYTRSILFLVQAYTYTHTRTSISLCILSSLPSHVLSPFPKAHILSPSSLSFSRNLSVSRSYSLSRPWCSPGRSASSTSRKCIRRRGSRSRVCPDENSSRRPDSSTTFRSRTGICERARNC